MFLDVDGVEIVEGSRVQRTRTGSARSDSMAAHVYDCFVLESYEQVMKQPDASKLTEALESEL